LKDIKQLKKQHRAAQNIFIMSRVSKRVYCVGDFKAPSCPTKIVNNPFMETRTSGET
jgi:hypothetical protein